MRASAQSSTINAQINDGKVAKWPPCVLLFWLLTEASSGFCILLQKRGDSSGIGEIPSGPQTPHTRTPSLRTRSSQKMPPHNQEGL